MFLLLACQGATNDGPSPSTAEVTCSDTSTEPRATSETIHTGSDGCGELDLADFQLIGDGELRLDLFVDARQVLPRVTAVADGAVFRGLSMEGEVALEGDEPLVTWRQGYTGDGEGSGVSKAAGDVSWWAGLAGRADGGSALVGVHAATVTTFTVSFADDGATRVVWGDQGEAVPLDAGDHVWLDPLYVAVGPDPNALWKDWALAVAAKVGVEVSPEAPPIGVLVDGRAGEAGVRAAAEAALASGGVPGRAPVGRLQVGAGWERAVGDWDAGDGFPSGMAAIADELSTAGLAPGLWIAPFVVDRASPIYAEHPDWWVRDAAGAELDHEGYAVLDVTHPDAAAWVGEQVAARVGEGWVVLELGHLSAAAREGRRAAPVTGTAAYALGLDLVRQAAGSAWLVGSDAPLLPSAGHLDVLRTGPDLPVPTDAEDALAGLRSAAGGSLARAFTDGRLWRTEPGALRLAEPVSLEAAHGAVVAAAIAGGVWTLGDDPSALPEERLELALSLDATDALDLDVWPGDPLASPSVYVYEDGSAGLLNLGDAPATLDGPGGVEVLDGEEAPAGPRTLPVGDGELWR